MENKKYSQYLIPSLIASVFLSTFVLFDGMFVGLKLSDIGLSAINIGWPIVAIMQSFAMALGISAGIYISRKMGEGKIEEASKAKFTSFILLGIASIIIILLIFFLRKPLIYLFGGNSESYKYAEEYLIVYLAGGLPYMLATALIPLLKNSGKSKIALISSVVAIIINFTLDYVFIFLLDWSLRGAAFASIIGQVVSFIISLIFYIKEFKGVSFNKKLIKELFVSSLAPFILNYSYDVILAITNRVAGYYNGNEAIAAYALLTYTLYIVNSVAQGVGDGIQPMFSYYSAKNDKTTLKKLLYKSLLISFIVDLIVIVGFYLLRHQLATLYNLSDESLKIYLYAIPFYSIGFVIISITKVIASYFYSISRNLFANIITVVEPFILTPLAYLLCIPFGFNALWWSYLIIQAALFIISFILYRLAERK